MIQIFGTVMEEYSMSPQESMDLHSCAETEQASDLGGREFLVAVSFEGQSLNGGSR